LDARVVEQIDPAACVDDAGRPTAFERSANLAYFRRATKQLDLADRAAMVCGEGDHVYGTTAADLLDFAADADLLINITGHLTWARVKDRCRRRVYLDLDPGYTQFWHAAGNPGPRLGGHDHYYTVGENIGAADCPIPAGGIDWRPIRQPVVLDRWPVVPPADAATGGSTGGSPAVCRFTTVASWRGAYGRAEFNGRDVRAQGPRVPPVRGPPRAGRAGGTRGVPVRGRAGHPPGRRGRPSPPKRQRVGGRRPAGRRAGPGRVPALRAGVRGGVLRRPGRVRRDEQRVVQRPHRAVPGLRPAGAGPGHRVPRHLPVGEGLVAFGTPDEATAGAGRIAAEYAAHSRAARRLAEAYFDSDKVLSKLLDEVGWGGAATPTARRAVVSDS
jgi:hypothetical protein